MNFKFLNIILVSIIHTSRWIYIFDCVYIQVVLRNKIRRENYEPSPIHCYSCTLFHFIWCICNACFRSLSKFGSHTSGQCPPILGDILCDLQKSLSFKSGCSLWPFFVFLKVLRQSRQSTLGFHIKIEIDNWYSQNNTCFQQKSSKFKLAHRGFHFILITI